MLCPSMNSKNFLGMVSAANYADYCYKLGPPISSGRMPSYTAVFIFQKGLRDGLGGYKAKE
jgi:hypothetical protein